MMKRISVGVLCLLLVCGSTLACQVPVFRYAFERWNPEHYQVMVLTENADEKLQAVVDSILVRGQGKRAADVEVVLMSDGKNSPHERLWKQHSVAGGPIAVTYYPPKAAQIGGQIAHITDASPGQLQGIVESPARTEIAKRLCEGESAVWVLLECGDEAKNSNAREVIENQLTSDAEWLKLPTPEELEIPPEVLDQVKVKLKVAFSVISVSRDDSKEQFLIDCLLNSESDLRDFDEPIAFPVFGRGLVLYALVGKGIAPETVRAASSFICGPCSCQVKEQNPGFDLLMNFDWEAAVGTTMISQPIPGTGATPKLLTIPSGRSQK